MFFPFGATGIVTQLVGLAYYKMVNANTPPNGCRTNKQSGSWLLQIFRHFNFLVRCVHTQQITVVGTFHATYTTINRMNGTLFVTESMTVTIFVSLGHIHPLTNRHALMRVMNNITLFFSKHNFDFLFVYGSLGATIYSRVVSVTIFSVIRTRLGISTVKRLLPVVVTIVVPMPFYPYYSIVYKRLRVRVTTSTSTLVTITLLAADADMVHDTIRVRPMPLTRGIRISNGIPSSNYVIHTQYRF